MIVSRISGNKLLVVRQADHGTQTGLISAAWGNDEFAPLTERARATSLAATHHEAGWGDWEQRPALDAASGYPVQFHAVKPAEHIPAYRNGIAFAAALDPWAGLLVSMHGAGLYNDRYGTYRLEELGEQALTAEERELVNEFLADMLALQVELFTECTGHRPASLPHEEPAVMRAYLLLQVWDRLSLQFAFRQAADGVISPVPLAGGKTTELSCRSAGQFALTLDPYPFADDTATFPVVGYTLTDRHYRNPEDFIAELTGAPPTTFDCAVTRALSARTGRGGQPGSGVA